MIILQYKFDHYFLQKGTFIWIRSTKDLKSEYRLSTGEREINSHTFNLCGLESLIKKDALPFRLELEYWSKDELEILNPPRNLPRYI